MVDWINLVMFIVISNSNILVEAADTTYMESTIRDYFSDTRHHEVNTDYKDRSKTFIHDEFVRFGLETEYQAFEYNGFSFANVIGIRTGNNFGTQHDKIIGVCAHYDTVSNTKGVDDNGSGVAAMLEVARQLFTKKETFNHTVIFLSPDSEEDGLMGSKRFIDDWIPAWFDKHYKDVMHNIRPYGFVVLDTIMEFNTTSNSQVFPNQQLQYVFPETISSIESDESQGDFITLIFRKSTDFELAQGFADAWKPDNRKQFQLEEFPLPVTRDSDLYWSSFRDFYRSDHYNFWTSNMTAIFLTDSANFRGDMIECYHNPCDNLDVMLTDDNIAFLGKTADTIASTILNLNPVVVTSGGTNVGISGVSLVLVVLVILLNTF